jgi:hypothetical protein
MTAEFRTVSFAAPFLRIGGCIFCKRKAVRACQVRFPRKIEEGIIFRFKMSGVDFPMTPKPKTIADARQIILHYAKNKRGDSLNGGEVHKLRVVFEYQEDAMKVVADDDLIPDDVIILFTICQEEEKERLFDWSERLFDWSLLQGNLLEI